MTRHRDHPHWDAYFKQRDALGEEGEPVIKVAGIDDDLDCLEDHLMPDWFEDRHLPPRSPMRGTNRTTIRRQGGTRGIAG